MTQRMVSVWLTHWRTDRLERQPSWNSIYGKNTHGGRPKPRVLFLPKQGGDRIVALNRAAEQLGLRENLLLTDAKAIAPTLQAIPSNPVEEAEELEALAHWCIRFSPWVSFAQPDALFLDVTGVTHLFGGEKEFLKTLRQTFSQMQINAHIAIADTAGAAWGFARYSGRPLIRIPPKQQKQRGASLTVKALRITADEAEQLENLGLKHIGQLYNISTHNIRPRFSAKLLKRVEQFLYPGRESLSPLIPEPEYCASMCLPEPVGKIEDIRAAVNLLLPRITQRLNAHGKGACRFTLCLYGAMGGRSSVLVKTSEPTQNTDHITCLFKERLNALEHSFDPTFDADAFSLHAHEIANMTSSQHSLTDASSTGKDTSLLIDRLTARLGRDAVRQYELRETHIPEQAAVAVAPQCLNGGVSKVAASKENRTSASRKRPILLLPQPEAIQVIAEVPDYPPRSFQWRKRTYRVVKAEGPERIASEWWRNTPDNLTRDYFQIEDETGARFWLFRKGLYEYETNAPTWFMHGMFA